MVTKLVFGLLLLVPLTITTGYERVLVCEEPNDDTYYCVPLSQCGYISNMIKMANVNPLTDEKRTYLSKMQCGYRDGQPLVCCTDLQIKGKPKATRPPISKMDGTLPEPGQCGIVEDRIFGGNETKFHEFPWLALIEYTKPFQESDHHCAGSLINDRYILTAGHCISGITPDWEPIRVRLGEWNTKMNPDCVADSRGYITCADPHVDVAIENVTVHPNYKPNSLNRFDDIALVRLSRSITYTDYIQPICLPIKDNLRHATFEGYKMDVAGWGLTEHGNRSNIKLKATLPIVDLDDCQRVYHSQQSRGFSRDLKDSQICAGGEKGTDSCGDDSGGSLIGVDSSNKTKVYSFLAGIVSYGPQPCGLFGWPGVYTKVSEYIDWILENIHP